MPDVIIELEFDGPPPPYIRLEGVDHLPRREPRVKCFTAALLPLLLVAMMMTFFFLCHSPFSQEHAPASVGGVSPDTSYYEKHIGKVDKRNNRWTGKGCHTWKCIKQVYDSGIGPSRILECPGGVYKFKAMMDSKYKTYSHSKTLFPPSWSWSEIIEGTKYAWKNGKVQKEKKGDLMECRSCKGTTFSKKSINFDLLAFPRSNKLLTGYPVTVESQCKDVSQVTLPNGWKFEVW